jgi:hypothetical protein
MQDGKHTLRAVAAGKSSAGRMRLVQTLDELSKVIRGWSQSYSFCNGFQTMTDLDSKIDEEINSLFSTYERLARGTDVLGLRRLLGVPLLADQRSARKMLRAANPIAVV